MAPERTAADVGHDGDGGQGVETGQELQEPEPRAPRRVHPLDGARAARGRERREFAAAFGVERNVAPAFEDGGQGYAQGDGAAGQPPFEREGDGDGLADEALGGRFDSHLQASGTAP